MSSFKSYCQRVLRVLQIRSKRHYFNVNAKVSMSRYFSGPSRTLDPTPPRPSASLVVVNASNEVLLVQRNPDSKSFGGVHVFPGGNFDEQQDDSLKMTALRETFEETGILLASAADFEKDFPSDGIKSQARELIRSQKILFRTFLDQYKLRLETSSLHPFTEWVTPPSAPRRFHARFFVTFMNGCSPSGLRNGKKRDQFPSPDEGQEVLSARFVHPNDILEEFYSKNITFMPPQFYILATLSELLSGRTNTAEQRDKVMALSRSSFGRMVINPVMLPDLDEQGRATLTFEGDETRGGSKGRLHRALAKIKGGAATEFILLRNFNILDGLEADSLTDKSKL